MQSLIGNSDIWGREWYLRSKTAAVLNAFSFFVYTDSFTSCVCVRARAFVYVVRERVCVEKSKWSCLFRLSQADATSGEGPQKHAETPWI